jgi:heat-inducible transcriptional repressor
MLEDRRLAVLRAIVEDYVSTHEPVGSKALVERHSLGVSPATIRNDMAALEDEGYIAQPHTSAGRIPTDLGYRLFVDRLSAVKPLSSGERRAIEQFLSGAVDLDDVMVRTVRLLAQVTRQVALVQYPSLTRSSVRHVELISISTTRLLLILIADTGRIEQRTIEINEPISEQLIGELRARLLTLVMGQPFSSLATLLEQFTENCEPALRPAAAAITATLLDAAMETVDERIVLGGTAHLARYGESFTIDIQPVLEALDETHGRGHHDRRHGTHRSRDRCRRIAINFPGHHSLWPPWSRPGIPWSSRTDPYGLRRGNSLGECCCAIRHPNP